MSIELLDDSDYYAPGLGVLPVVIPVFYVIGASSITGAAMAWGWLSRDEWSTDEYNDNMKRINESLTLWDQLAWKMPGPGLNACWSRNATKREEWKSFWKRFSAFYKQHGQQSVYLPDSTEKEARRLVRELAVWGEWLENTCNISTISGRVAREEDASSSAERLLKLGAILVGGALALSVVSSLKNITRG